MSTTDDVVDVTILCGEDHPHIAGVRCGRAHPHSGVCRGIEPRYGTPRAWNAPLRPAKSARVALERCQAVLSDADLPDDSARDRARSELREIAEQLDAERAGCREYYEREYEAACERVRELTAAADDLRSQRGQCLDELGAARGALERCQAVLGNNVELSDDELVNRVGRLAHLEGVVYRLLAEFATPVPADVSPLDHLTSVLRADADRAAEIIRTRQAASHAVAGLKRIRSNVEATLADVREVIATDHPAADCRIDGDLVRAAVLDACPDLLSRGARQAEALVPYAYEAREWVGDGATVECFSGRDPDRVIHRGRAIGFTEAPTVMVQCADGRIVSWVLGITRRVRDDEGGQE